MEAPNQNNCENTPDTPLLPDGQIDLNAIRDQWASGEREKPTKSLSEVFQEVGHHGMHIYNPDAHPDEEQGPRFTKEQMDEIRAKIAQVRAERQNPGSPQQ